MIALKDNLNGLHDNCCVKVYDPQSKKLIGVYPSFANAGKKLGLNCTVIQQRCARKTRVYSPVYGKEIACRLSKKTAEEELLINKSQSRFL